MSDFDRNAWCFLGMPIDVVSYQQALDQVSSSVEGRQRCFFSTPNLNFIITALKDRSFLNSVILSDLVLLDGMPPVWIAKILGIPGVHKVSGSNLFESLSQNNPQGSRKIRIFLFGGEDGVAEAACERINRYARGIECAGHYYPGFDSVEAMSSDEILGQVNKAEADFVVVALGAKKGQAWIVANRAKLKAPVLSHLGAVVNFAAGKIARAPAWMQTCGLEWIWRIFQEPSLWKRYLFDAIALFKLMVLKIIPYVLWRGVHFRQLRNRATVDYSISEDGQCTTIDLQGNCIYGTIAPLRNLFDQESRKHRSIKIDLAEAGLIDGAFLGLCLMLYKQMLAQNLTLSFVNVNRVQRRIFTWHCVDYLL